MSSPDADNPTGRAEQQPAGQPPSKLKAPLKSKLPILGGTVLICEVIVMYLAVLVGYGLRPVPLGWVIAGALVITAMCIVAAATLPRKAGQKRMGVALGWAAQVLVGLACFAMPALIVVFIVFGVMWGAAVYWGLRIDREATAWVSRYGYVQPPEED